jgi:hypothetical protein
MLYTISFTTPSHGCLFHYLHVVAYYCVSLLHSFHVHGSCLLHPILPLGHFLYSTPSTLYLFYCSTTFGCLTSHECFLHYFHIVAYSTPAHDCILHSFTCLYSPLLHMTSYSPPPNGCILHSPMNMAASMTAYSTHSLTSLHTQLLHMVTYSTSTHGCLPHSSTWMYTVHTSLLHTAAYSTLSHGCILHTYT